MTRDRSSLPHRHHAIRHRPADSRLMVDVKQQCHTRFLVSGEPAWFVVDPVDGNRVERRYWLVDLDTLVADPQGIDVLERSAI